MYYFKFYDENLISIDVEAKPLDPQLDSKIRISFDPKHVLTVGIYDIDGNIIPVKKNAELRKTIFNSLQNKEWEKFLIDGTAIQGIINEEEEFVEPIYALYPGQRKREKINPYNKWTNALFDKGLPPIEGEEQIIFKKRTEQYLHVYYRQEIKIIHVCFDEFENTVVNYEVFLKALTC